MKFELVMDNDVPLATWDAPAFEPSYSFPPEVWKEGIMELSGVPIIVTGGVRLIVDGWVQWRRAVPQGEEKRCCRDN